MQKPQLRFEEIYQENYPKVIRLCRGYVNGDEAMAKDLAQEAFIKVWENLPSFRQEAGIGTWIYRITVNTCLLQLRKKKYTQDIETIERISDREEENHPSKESQLRQMYACIHKLSKESKGIIVLELEGLPQKEIAEIMGLSHEAIRVRIYRIKKSLTKCVQNDSI